MTSQAPGTDDAADFCYRLSSVVRFGDLDLRGHMNNVAVLRTLETARVEYFFEAGVGPPTRYECVVASLQVDFASAAQYRETLLCGVRVRTIGRTSLTMVQRLWRADDEVLIATARVTLVHRSGEPKHPTRVPDDWRQRIARFEQEPVEGAEREAS